MPPEGSATSPARRAAAASVVRTLLSATALTYLYFVVPVASPSLSGGVFLAVGLVVLPFLLAWQIRSITRHRAPRLRALEVLGTTGPFVLLLFAMSYFLMARHDGTAFSSPLTRLDALYFTVTTFATVGFGDFVARSEPARAAVTVQMVVDLVIIGVGARLVLGAIRIGLARGGERTPGDPAEQQGGGPVREPEPTPHP